MDDEDENGITPIPRYQPLPRSRQELIDQRRSNRMRSIIDQVEDYHLVMWEEDEYYNLLSPVFSSEALEGSLNANYYRAAELIRDRARAKRDGNPVAIANMETLKKAMLRVMTRYNIRPKQRLLGFEPQPPTDEAEAA